MSERNQKLGRLALPLLAVWFCFHFLRKARRVTPGRRLCRTTFPRHPCTRQGEGRSLEVKPPYPVLWQQLQQLATRSPCSPAEIPGVINKGEEFLSPTERPTREEGRVPSAFPCSLATMPGFLLPLRICRLFGALGRVGRVWGICPITLQGGGRKGLCSGGGVPICRVPAHRVFARGIRSWAAAPLAMAAKVDLTTSTDWKEAKCK